MKDISGKYEDAQDAEEAQKPGCDFYYSGYAHGPSLILMAIQYDGRLLEREAIFHHQNIFLYYTLEIPDICHLNDLIF